MNMQASVTERRGIEPVILTSDIAKAWSVDTRTVEAGMKRRGIPVIELSARKRAVLASNYALLLGKTAA